MRQGVIIMIKVISAYDAAKKISDKATLCLTGCTYRLMPEAILAALEERFKKEGKPNDLKLIYPIMVEKSRAGHGGAGSGINHLAHNGMLKRVIGGSFSRKADEELNQLITSNAVESYNLPMGTIFQWFRTAASGKQGLITDVGLGTYVDPRIEGGKMNDITREDLSEVVEFKGREYLYYPPLSIDVALISGTYADEKGNITLEQEAFSLGVLYLAMAAKNSGGRVIAQVKRVIKKNTIHPKKVVVPGALVDDIVIYDNDYEDERDPAITGEIREIITTKNFVFSPQTVIARRTLNQLKEGQIVNLGAGIPMYTISRMARKNDIYKKINFTIEQGPFGGLPEAGGIARNPEAFLDSLEVFDFYEGGGIDTACLSFAQVDSNGNVNVSRFANMMPGGGGFINITHRTKNIIYCGTLTANGLNIEFDDKKLKIVSEGKIKKFVSEVDQITFNGRRAIENGQNILFVTERAVFKLQKEGIVLIEVAPGIDPDRDILPHIDFEVKISPRCKSMNIDIFR